ncbi:MAG: hypothetical protein ACRC23_02120 [Aeromonas jandaei]
MVNKNLKQIDIFYMDGTIKTYNMDSTLDNKCLENELKLTLMEFMDLNIIDIKIKSIEIDNYDGGFETTIYYFIQNLID